MIIFIKYYFNTFHMVNKEVYRVISFRGERNKWIDFVAKVKKDNKSIWEVMEKLIDIYLKN